MWRNYSPKVQPPARPAFQGGLSIGRWIDTDGDGRYDTLEIETRGFKGPHVYGDSGIPLHRDNQLRAISRYWPDHRFRWR
jgi:hypothetical protein